MKKVLVIDDDQGILDAVEMLLTDSGYSVKTLINGNKIDEMMDQFIPDIILLDMLISGSDGRDISQHLKKNEDTKKIPIIMIAAYPQIKQEAEKCGADDFLAKPFDINDLLYKVQQYLNK